MATLSAKPSLRISVLDWDANNKKLSDTAEYERHVSHEIRQDGRILCNEANSRTKWDETDNTRRLRNRVWDISCWTGTLESCSQEMDKEMEALTVSKEETERALAATAVPLEVTVENLTLREGRRGTELVSDPVEGQLKKEVEVIDGMQRVLQQHIDRAFEQLCILQEARQRLTHDLQNKMEALDIDTTCLSLSETSPDISLKPNPYRIPISSTTPQQWEQFSLHNVTRAREEIQMSLQLREDMSLTRAQLRNELEAQRQATEFAIRKRTHNLERAHKELNWQLQNTEDEIMDMERDIRMLDEDIRAKTAPLKLAQTRLGNRTKRPGVDLCRDEVQYGLVEETKQIEATILALRQKLSQAKHSLQALMLHKARMAEDLSRKQEVISLEQRSMEARGRRNVQLDQTLVAVAPHTNSSRRHNLLQLTP
ncbi:tektin-2 [Aplochiton taeniatus]